MEIWRIRSDVFSWRAESTLNPTVIECVEITLAPLHVVCFTFVASRHCYARRKSKLKHETQSEKKKGKGEGGLTVTMVSAKATQALVEPPRVSIGCWVAEIFLGRFPHVQEKI